MALNVTIPFPYPPVGQADAAKTGENFSALLKYLNNNTSGGKQNYFLVNVKDYGAYGDGTHDDTAAIQSAIATNRTVYFPEGTYKVSGALTLVSNLRILGAGKYITTIQLPQSNINPYDFSMFESTGNISNVSFESIGLRGNYSFQSTAISGAAHDGWGIMMDAGSATNITIRDCYIREFGASTDAGAGGGVSLIPDVAVASSTLDNINILDNHFGLIHGVPGVYLAPYYGTAGSGIGCNISRNRFEGGGVQNCVYVLGSTANKAYNVNVDNNEFILRADVDVCIEFNGVWGGSISHNMIRSTTAGAGTGILIRGSATDSIATNYLVIDGNTLLNENTSDKTGISLVAFDASGHQDHVIISNNMLYGYGKTSGQAIQVGLGSRNVSVINNQITAEGGTSLHWGILVSDFSNVMIKDNLIKNTDVPIVISGSGTLRNLTIGYNEFNGCGTNGGAHIVTTGGTLNLAGLVIEENRIFSSIAGTAYLAVIASSTTSDNRLINNHSDVSETSTPTMFAEIVTQTEVSYLAGVTSAIQTQIDSKLTKTLTDTHIFVGSALGVATDVPMSGDATLANTGAMTLATVNSNVGSFGSSTAIPSFTVNAKGLITAASTSAVVAPAGTLTGTTLASGVVTSSLTAVGTIGTGVWNGTTIGVGFGGTGQTSYTNGQLLIGNTTGNTLTKATLTGTTDQINVANGTGSITLSTPQNINTTSSPTFVGGTFTGTLDGQGQLKGKGTATNDNAASGYIGEIISTFTDSASRVTLSNGVWNDVGSITLTAGDWDISVLALFEGNVTGVQKVAGIGTASGNSATGISFGSNTTSDTVMPTSNSDTGLTVPPYRVSISGSTTYYLKVLGTFSVGTLKAYGTIRARRIR